MEERFFLAEGTSEEAGADVEEVVSSEEDEVSSDESEVSSDEEVVTFSEVDSVVVREEMPVSRVVVVLSCEVSLVFRQAAQLRIMPAARIEERTFFPIINVLLKMSKSILFRLILYYIRNTNMTVY